MEVQSKKMLIRPWLLVLLLIAILSCVACLCWKYLQKTNTQPANPVIVVPSATDGWATYKSNYNYSIKYPTNYSVKDEIDFINATAPEFNKDLMSSVNFGKNIQSGDYEISIIVSSDTLENIRALSCWMMSDKSLETEITLAGQKAYKTTCVASPSSEAIGATKYKGGEKRISIVTQKNDYVYTFVYFQADLIQDNSLIFSQMLSTLKFSTTSVSKVVGQTYNNSKYGFSLIFPESWVGYKFKEANNDGSTLTYYANMPTKITPNLESATNYEGYFSPFAISVYTLVHWEKLQAEEGLKPTLLAKNADFVFAWIESNGITPSDFKGKEDIKTIITSFKLVN